MPFAKLVKGQIKTNARIGGFLSCFRPDNDKIGIDEGFYASANFCLEF
ncbi:hypothetical protein [Winogradskyella sp. UBA3174]|nr:hypothetical protein [Winogradskyella sp. UBA3174]|tara:strand:+ start:2177 stop:2320 length:144 start_codon:yes stop_codon:yes gene_type:complete